MSFSNMVRSPSVRASSSRRADGYDGGRVPAFAPQQPGAIPLPDTKATMDLDIHIPSGTSALPMYNSAASSGGLNIEPKIRSSQCAGPLREGCNGLRVACNSRRAAACDARDCSQGPSDAWTEPGIIEPSPSWASANAANDENPTASEHDRGCLHGFASRISKGRGRLRKAGPGCAKPSGKSGLHCCRKELVDAGPVGGRGFDAC